MNAEPVKITGKKFKLKLVGEDGNAFSVLGRFARGAKKAGWSEADIKAVRSEAMSGDYQHLLATVMKYADAC